MPIFEIGEMFGAPGFIIVTTNSFLTSEIKLVMGRGAAYDLKVRAPGIDLIFGKMIREICGHLGRYGVLFYGRYGVFQVKYRFNRKARLDLITYSVCKLSTAAQRDKSSIFNLNYPGIGNGGLTEHQVRPILEMLPINVHVWKKKEVW